MKYVILGGGGFIGSSIASRLLRDGHHVRIFDRTDNSLARGIPASERLEWVVGNVFDLAEVSAAIKGTDIIVHSVSSTLPKTSDDDPIFDVQSNLVGTLHILNAASKSGIKRIVFLSSGGTVYGNPAYIPVDEDHPTNPLVSYGITKLAIEKYLALYQNKYGIRTISLRVSNPYGEWQKSGRGQGAVGVFLESALAQNPIAIWGDGNVVRDFIYIGDVADAVVRSINYSGNFKVFNISSGVGTSLNMLLSIIGGVLNVPLNIRYGENRIFDVPINILSNQLAVQELGWKPSVPLSEGVRRTAKWMLQQGGVAD